MKWSPGRADPWRRRRTSIPPISSAIRGVIVKGGNERTELVRVTTGNP